ncbi:MAG: response regulator transcription factor [Elusimicrobiota bacterium]|nr:response regulator transcription factor [Elusimicrobiota bacterium]
MKKILIAEDDRPLASLLHSLLKDAGYETKTAFDGASALKSIKEFKPDLVLLDVMLPLIDGYRICKTLSEETQYEQMPKIVILAVRKTDQDKKISEFAGADMFITKPFDPDDLLNKIKTLLQ